MNPFIVYLIFLISVVIGPSQLAKWSLFVTAVGLTAAFALRRSFQGRTMVLLGMLGMMLAESLLFVGVSSYIDMLGRAPAHVASWDYFSILHAVNLGIVLIGGIAAACAGLFIGLKKTRIGMSKMFPQLQFLGPAPVHVNETAKRLACLAGVASPNVSLVDSGVPSAFTVWANRKYSVALSVGLLESLDDNEVEACLAHEISHIKNGDFTVRFLATLAKIALFAKPLSYFIEPAVYRAREFLADRTAAQLIGGPDALISALSKLKDSDSLAVTSPEGLMCVCNLSGGKSMLRILDKQPDLTTRIETLREMKRA
ncbi:MAG: M48 family metalloprotease [Candidatus Bathyarchaeia archaeon]|jgi:heat shock protein HtpX